jgi:hypothetical protein
MNGATPWYAGLQSKSIALKELIVSGRSVRKPSQEAPAEKLNWKSGGKKSGGKEEWRQRRVAASPALLRVR